MTIQKILPLLFCLFPLFYGCDSEPFPVGGEQSSGITQVPFVPTLTFGFKTGTEEISGLEGDLKIISGADVNNLSVTASTGEQVPENGLISGTVVDPVGKGVRNVSIGGTDVDGNIFRKTNDNDDENDKEILSGVKDASGQMIAPIFYNSINGFPEFINVDGTGPSGSFTALNVPPGEYYLKAVRGGRGGTHLSTFAGGVSMTKMSVFPVRIPSVAINGEVLEGDEITPVAGAEIFFPGLGGKLTSRGAGTYSGTGFGSDSSFLIKVSAAAHHDTYRFLSSDLGLIVAGAVTQEIVHNLRVFSDQEITSLAAEAGVTLLANRGIIYGSVIESGGQKANALILVTGEDGEEIGLVRFFDANARLNCCLSETTTHGGFLVFNLRPGDVFIKAHATDTASDGTEKLIKFSGSIRTPVFSRGVTQDWIDLRQINRVDEFSTLRLSGNVIDENGTKVGPASIALLGIADSVIPDAGGNGAYTIPRAGNADDLLPVLANSRFTARVDAVGHTTTYQEVFSGSEDLNRNLTVVSQARINITDSTKGAILGRVQNRRNGGRVDEVELLVTQVSDKDSNTIATGVPVGKILYFNESAQPDTALTATSSDGRFLIKDLPPGLIMIKLDSSDDSGNRIVRVFPDGVTLADLTINHVPENLPVSGTLRDLRGQAVSGARLSILGEQGDFPSEDFTDPSKGISFPSFGTFTVKAEKDGAVPTYNTQILTGLKPLPDQSLVLTNPTELKALAVASGLDLDLEKGIVFGEVTESHLEVSRIPLISGNTPQDIAAGFFNDDGFQDLAVLTSNGFAGQVEIFLGKEGSGFSPVSAIIPIAVDSPQPFPVNADSRSITVADMNNDGFSDLVIANFGHNSLSLLLGQGDGFFSGLPDLREGIGSGPIIVLAEDLDLDDNVDLVVVNESSSNVSVLMGDGRLAFSSLGNPYCNPGPCEVEPDPKSITVGEFDGDGLLNLAIVSSSSPSIQFISSDITTTTIALSDSGKKPSAIITGDVNKDGHLDLLVANDESDDIASFLGNGNGRFVKFDCNPDTEAIDNCPISPTGDTSHVRAMILLDFDQDGRQDLAIIDEDPSQLSILLGKGNGQFGTASSVFNLLGFGPSAFVAGDFNQDSEVDFVVLNTFSGDLNLLESKDGFAEGIFIEARDSEGETVGSVRYFNDSSGINPSLDRTGATGRFIIFDLPLAMTTIRSNPESSTTALAGNVLVNLSEPGTLSTVSLKVDTGTSSSVVIKGSTCRPLGEICARVGNVEFSFLGAKNFSFQEKTDTHPATCAPNSSGIGHISRLSDGGFEICLDPHSSYTVKLIAPKIELARDSDGDGVPDTIDNCPNIINPDQANSTGTQSGDACALLILDNDSDGIPNDRDNCPFTPNPDQEDVLPPPRGNGIGDACDVGG